MGSGEGERGNSPGEDRREKKLENYEEPLSGYLEH